MLKVELVGRCWAGCESVLINTITRTNDEDRILIFSPEFSLEGHLSEGQFRR